jgi:hypothetical protein
MIEWVINNELEMIRKAAVMANLKFCPNICLEGLRRTLKDLSVPYLQAKI